MSKRRPHVSYGPVQGPVTLTNHAAATRNEALPDTYRAATLRPTMKILHVVQSLSPEWGGIARVVPMLASGLCSAGDNCRIATLSGGRYGSPPHVSGVEVLTFAAPDSSRLGRSSDFARRIGDLVRDADVVHLHGLWTGQNWATGKAARRAGRPYIMTPHSMMMPWAWKRSRWKKLPAGLLFEHANLRRAACLHALADGEAEHMRRLGFNDRITVIPNGLHVAEYDRLPAADGLEARYPQWKGHKLLVMIGRISPQKGIVPGMQACFDNFPVAKDWHLVVAGPDEFGIRRMLEAAITRKGMTERVTFTGMLAPEEVRALLGRASLLIQPSLSEGLSMSILEALAAGVPVLISDACNMPEVQSAGAGRVVAPLRAAVAKALREIVSAGEEALREMGRRARALAREKYDWAALLPKYREMYERVAAGR
ncbi:MAG: hypothetical protein DCC65_12945 [Planctomycetota bacterium]|nr:MAG: hypothetical protein DCC65_12945 [Planctomycetota bacterium]